MCGWVSAEPKAGGWGVSASRPSALMRRLSFSIPRMQFASKWRCWGRESKSRRRARRSVKRIPWMAENGQNQRAGYSISAARFTARVFTCLITPELAKRQDPRKQAAQARVPRSIVRATLHRTNVRLVAPALRRWRRPDCLRAKRPGRHRQLTIT